MSHWLLDSIEKERREVLALADKVQVYRELLNTDQIVDFEEIERVASALELATMDLLLDRFEENSENEKLLCRTASDSFRLLKLLIYSKKTFRDELYVLRASALGVLGERSSDVARWLRELESRNQWPGLLNDSQSWQKRTLATVTDVWLRMIRKHGWKDRDAVLQRISDLRQQQSEFEHDYLNTLEPQEAKVSALELIGLYHLAKAAEILAYFITDGAVEGNHQVQALLDSHFDRAIAVCDSAKLVELEPIVKLLAATAEKLVNNSIWTVTRAVNSRVTLFVQSLVDRGRGNRAIFDVLPPQRQALAEQGLLGSSRRAVVVSLPTSSGKTLIAEFRILQALNQFEDQAGWVAYLAPTRALVNQVTRQLRRDFTPLKIVVERVSPALEVDGIESDLLSETNMEGKFRVLVTTPEKLDLLLRQGWEEKIGRPLTLVVVDEAHNIQDSSRGLKLELLLATINKECAYAQFLLLTPFIKNAREVARWLGGQSSDDISLSVDWQPNDRVIGVLETIKGDNLNKQSFDYSLSFDPVHTTRNTMAFDGVMSFPKEEEIASTYSQANSQSKIAAIAAQHLKERGSVILMHSTPRYVWALARLLLVEANRKTNIHGDIRIVQEYLQLEMGKDFPLIEMLEYGIGVHHSGLPEEVRVLIEWLFENSRLDFLVATTTIAQGVNFPVNAVVMAAHQYPFGDNMPPEDFWNIAGRAGRVSQGQLGVVALSAHTPDRSRSLKSFINEQTRDLNSALIQMAKSAEDLMNDLGMIVYQRPEWSSFLQYLAHTYRQMGEPSNFARQIEQVLRGTLGFEKLRQHDSRIARLLLSGIEQYAAYLQKPGQPLKLVDSTGFSLQSINTVLKNKGNINETSWNEETLFKSGDGTLQDMMGVLLRVPELRQNLEAVTGGERPDGDKLALILKDWVSGESLPEIARKYFQTESDDMTVALTRCGQDLFGKLSQTTSWGLGALLAITGRGLDKEKLKQLSDLPSQVFYGVNSSEAIMMRLLGVPRNAASPLADHLGSDCRDSIQKVRAKLKALNESDWTSVMGTSGATYSKVWRIIEGLAD